MRDRVISVTAMLENGSSAEVVGHGEPFGPFFTAGNVTFTFAPNMDGDAKVATARAMFVAATQFYCDVVDAVTAEAVAQARSSAGVVLEEAVVGE